MKNKEDFQEEFKKKQLDKSAADARRSFTANDEAIHEILMKVLAKWRADRTAEHDADQEEWRETVVLSAGGRKGYPAISPKEKGEALTETVIITPSGKGREAIRPLMRPLPEDGESLDETVSLQEEKRGALLKKDIGKTPDHNILTETVIVKPGKKKDK